MTLREQAAVNFYATVLNAEHFAEWVTYVPASGPARAIVAKIEVTDSLSVGGPGAEQVEELTVSLGRLEANAKGGVDRPIVGEQLIRADGRRYGYTGRVLNQTAYSCQLHFARRVDDQVGRGQKD